MNILFRALNDATRREILELLKDGIGYFVFLIFYKMGVFYSNPHLQSVDFNYGKPKNIGKLVDTTQKNYLRKIILFHPKQIQNISIYRTPTEFGHPLEDLKIRGCGIW